MAEPRLELMYMTRTYSQETISQITGIPRSTVGFVIRGERELPGKYIDPLHYQYTNTTYDNLIYSGANHYAASSVAGLPPAQIIDLENRWQRLIYRRAEYRIKKELKDTGIEYTEDYVRSQIPIYMQSTIDSYHKLSVDLQQAENNVWYVKRIEI